MGTPPGGLTYMRWLTGLGLLLMVGCSPAPASATMTSEGLAAALQSSGLPVGRIDIATAESDQNHLLGRPNQYVGKMNWHDLRLSDEGDMSSTVEAFTTAADLDARFRYTDALSKSGGAFAQYIYRNDSKRLLLRLPHDLTPAQAAEYQSWLAVL
jgi:hypothetical protein